MGYFKPLADRIEQRQKIAYDRDAELFKEVLALKERLQDLSAAYDYATMVEDARREGKDFKSIIIEKFEQISQGKDFILIEGPRNYSYGSYVGLSAGAIGKALGSKIVVIANGDLGVVVDKTLAANYYMQSIGAQILGVIINGVPKAELEEMKEIALPALEGRGINVLGIVPGEDKLSILTPRLIAEGINARILAGEGGLDHNVDCTLVGAMTVEHALKRLRNYRNIALITGGDRTDMQLAAYEVSTACLVLTGGIYPDPIVLAKADEFNIPILLVPEDTYTTAKQVECVEPLIKPEEKEKIELVQNLVQDSVELERILDLISS